MSAPYKNGRNLVSSNSDLRSALIQEVRHRPPLWDERDRDFRNKDVICQLWSEVGDILGIAGNIARTKWNNLKDKYNTELGKEIDALERNCTYKSKWPYYDCMRFIDGDCDDQQKLKMDIVHSEPKEYNFYDAPKNGGCIDLCELCRNCVNCRPLREEPPTPPANRTPRVCSEAKPTPTKFEAPTKIDEDDQAIKVYVQKKDRKGKSPQTPKKGGLGDKESSMRAIPIKKESHGKFSNPSEKFTNTIEKQTADQCTEFEIQQSNEDCLRDEIKVTQGNIKPVKSREAQVCRDDKQKDMYLPPSPCTRDQASDACSENEETELKKNPNYQFLLSLLPYLNELSSVECLETRAQIQCLVNEAFRRRGQRSYFPNSYY